MSFNDFDKDDLDFGDLISEKKPKKKNFPKPSEGLRFLSRNLRDDTKKRVQKNNKSIEKVIENELAPPSSGQNSLGTSIVEKKSDSHIDGYKKLVERQSLNKSESGSANIDQSSNHDNVSQSVSRADTKSSIEKYEPDAEKIQAIEKNTPSTNCSIECNEPRENPPAKGSNISIENSRPSNVASKISIEENEPSGLASSNKLDSHVLKDDTTLDKIDDNLKNRAVTLTQDNSSSEAILEPLKGKLSEPITPIVLEKADNNELNTTIEKIVPHDHGSKSSIATKEQGNETQLGSNYSKDTNLDSSNISIERFEPLRDGTTPSIETFKPTTAKSTSHDDSVSSIDVFRPFIPLDDNRLYAIRLKSNFLKLSNGFFRHTIGKLDPKSLDIYLFLYRNSYGWNKNFTNIPISNNFIKNGLGLSKTTVIKCLKKLEQSKLIGSKNFVAGMGQVYEVFYHDLNGNVTNAPVDSNYLTLDNNFFEISELPTTHKLIYLFLYKESIGFGKNLSNRLLTSKLSKTINLTTRTVQEAVRNLIKLGIISRIEDKFSSKGIIYRTLLPQEFQPVKATTSLIFKLAENQDLDAHPKEQGLSIEENLPGTYISIEGTSNGTADSIEQNIETTPNPSIEISEPSPTVRRQTLTNSKFAATGSNLSTEDSEHKETNKIKNKTSSIDADDFFHFIKTKFESPKSDFPVSKQILSEILVEHGLEKSKHHIDRLLPRIKEAKSPVGFWRHSLSNPDNFPELNQRTEKELLEEKRQLEAEERRAVALARRREEEKIKRVNSAWDALDKSKQKEFITKSEKYFRDSMNGKLPPQSAVLERAKKLFCNKDLKTSLNEA